MKFSELTECPFCGNDEFYINERVKGITEFYQRFDGEQADNTELYEGLEHTDLEGAYCSYCKKYLGNQIKDTVGKEAERALKRKDR